MKEAVLHYQQLLEDFSYKNLSEIKPETYVDVYAIVVDTKPFKRISNGRQDYIFSITLIDPSLNGESITANFFKSKTESLPQVRVGSILVLKNIKVNEFNNRIQLASSNRTLYTAFDPVSLEEKPSVDVFYKIEDHEKIIIRALHSWNQQYMSLIKEKRVQMATIIKRPILQTDQLIHNPAMYFDYIGMVVAYNRPDSRSVVDLVLTDYTINPKPYFNDEYNVKGISYEFLLQCTLWDNHADNCPELNFGDYVFIENCTRNARSQSLEISVKGNRSKKHQLTVLEEKDPSLKNLLERRLKFDGTSETVIKRDITKSISSIRTSLTCSRTINTVKDILEKEKAGIYLLRAFILNYQPKDIKDWIRGWCSTCQKTYNDPSKPCINCKKEVEIIYQFAFLMEDETGMKIIVYGFEKDADLLFSKVPAREAYLDASKFEELKRIVGAICNEENIYFDMNIISYDIPKLGRCYRFCETEFITEDKNEER
ncbi:uncharacterized protein BX663DRAFT_548568 [Cokeromyces recurvatus]|uniref:uncharacterized protein n=1 Tax=Cokeromyces recurvatus TaxID=90255 RepID=UPI00221FD502|nr:uncharacterized protein BX663DRAFT_548568 [Cokeromyces recurvatus]KAI7906380.1 hypothetical protein BX663DRAFT_548568 [Cokeromyces recurvatus]